MTQIGKREVIIESVRNGAYVKVTAIDVATGIEATIVGDPSAGAEAVNALAIQKLDYVLKRQNDKK